jgi:hypothetical protein
MRKWLVGAGIAVAAIVLVVGGAAFAASNVSDVQAARGAAQAAVPFLGRGGFGMQRGDGPGEFGQGGRLHEYLSGALADALSLTPDELEAGLAEGQSLVEIAEAQGIAEEDLTASFEQVRTEALQAAVDDGALTQEQADWMLEHPAMLRMLTGGRMHGAWGGNWNGSPMGPGFSGPR